MIFWGSPKNYPKSGEDWFWKHQLWKHVLKASFFKAPATCKYEFFQRNFLQLAWGLTGIYWPSASCCATLLGQALTVPDLNFYLDVVDTAFATRQLLNLWWNLLGSSQAGAGRCHLWGHWYKAGLLRLRLVIETNFFAGLCPRIFSATFVDGEEVFLCCCYYLFRFIPFGTSLVSMLAYAHQLLYSSSTVSDGFSVQDIAFIHLWVWPFGYTILGFPK